MFKELRHGMYRGPARSQEAIQAILRHLGLWDVRSRPPAKAHAPPVTAEAALPHYTPICGAPQYPWEAYL